MDHNPTNPTGIGHLIVRKESELTKITSDPVPAMVEIMNRSLAHIQTSKSLSSRHRIGEHHLFEPDYRLICAWAEELKLTAEESLNLLIDDCHNKIEIVDGKIKTIEIDHDYFNISNIPSINGLEIVNLCLVNIGYSENLIQKLNLSVFPTLASLTCIGHNISELDLRLVPQLKSLNCSYNRIEMLNFSYVPKLSYLDCSNNPLRKISLAPISNLKQFYCRDCRFTELDLSLVPNLLKLDCYSYCGERTPPFHLWACRNEIHELNLEFVRELESLDCSGNPLGKLDLSSVNKLINLKCEYNRLNEIDISKIKNLKTLSCTNQFEETEIEMCRELGRHGIRIIQRADQNFL